MKQGASTHTIEIWKISDIKPYDANAKKHSDKQVDSLANAIQKFGWTSPIVVWKDGSIIAGHGRRLAAIKLKLDKVPVIVRRDLTKAEADALRLADNRVASTEYDQGLIQEELMRLADQLETENFTLLDIGFDEKEINFTLSDLGEIDESFFVDDIAQAVEDQKAQNKMNAKNIDETAAPVVDALGFKRVTVEQSRAIREAIKKIEAKTGLEGAEAFVKFLESV